MVIFAPSSIRVNHLQFNIFIPGYLLDKLVSSRSVTLLKITSTNLLSLTRRVVGIEI